MVFSSALDGIFPGTGAFCFTVGAVTGSAGCVLGATVGAVTASPALTYAAKKTRKFLSNDDINSSLSIISEITDRDVQHYFINKIINEDKRSSWLSVRSYESYCLINSLKSDDYEIEDKWKELISYLKAKTSSGAYVNNGKKLFNTVLTLMPEIQCWKAIKEGPDSFREFMKDLPSDVQRLRAKTYYDCYGENQLHWAARLGNTGVVDYCLEHKQDLNRKVVSGENAGKTAVQLADACGESKFADYLVQKGADDTAMTNLKNKIKLLKEIVFLDNWKKEGTALFGADVPANILTLRNLFNKYQGEDELDNRAKVQAIYNRLEKMKFGSSLWRGSHASRLYKLMQDIGNNDLEDPAKDSLMKLKHDIEKPKPTESRSVLIAGMSRMLCNFSLSFPL